MKYLVIGNEAADQMASNRLLQSNDFDQANQLVEVLLSKSFENAFDTRLILISIDDGVYIYHRDKKSTHFLVFDIETSKIFNNRNAKDVIVLLQKTIRFALRYWNKLAHPQTERHIQDSTKSIIFPFPFTTSSSVFRITVEECPDKKREDKRKYANKTLLIYKVGNDDGGGKNEEVPLTNFRKAISNIDIAFSKVQDTKRLAPQGPEISSFSITKVDNIAKPLGFSSLGFDNWLELLTHDQKKFVTQTVNGPEKIEGPAGTGKTLCLVLKCINNLLSCENLGLEHNSLFITHSISTKKTIEELFEGNGAGKYLRKYKAKGLIGVTVTTLQEWCIDNINVKISETELIDRDAMDAKESQLLYINQAFDDVLSSDFATHRKFLSSDFIQFLETENSWNICEMLQHEISIMIKGRADEDFERYKKLERIQYGLPLNNEHDLGFVFTVFKKYSGMLSKLSQYDTDDVILTAIGNLDTPIWRRIKEKEGVDSLFIDETHLFNINEFSVFHHLIKSIHSNNIIFCIDTAQATGDRGLTSQKYYNAILNNDKGALETNVKAVFRCSPEIVNLAFSVTSSGASLFTNFNNPMELATSTFTAEEERKAQTPSFIMYPTDDDMIENVFKRADFISADMATLKSEILIVPFSGEIFKKLERYIQDHNKPIEMLKHRGDTEVVNRAKRSGRFVLGAPDYVGGLEFDGVILVGVDDGRVPSTAQAFTEDSLHYLTYTAHNRLYVAITRARYRVEILANKTMGPSKLFQNAITNSFVNVFYN